MFAFTAPWRLTMVRPAIILLVVAGSFLMSAALMARQPSAQARSVDTTIVGPPAILTLRDDKANYTLDYPAAWHVEFDEGWLTTLYPTTNTTATLPSGSTTSKIEIVPIIGATTLGRLFEEVRLEGPEIHDILPRTIDGAPALQLDITTFDGEPARLVLVVFGEQGLRVMAYGQIDTLGPILETLRPARQLAPNTWRI